MSAFNPSNNSRGRVLSPAPPSSISSDSSSVSEVRFGASGITLPRRQHRIDHQDNLNPGITRASEQSLSEFLRDDSEPLSLTEPVQSTAQNTAAMDRKRRFTGQRADELRRRNIPAGQEMQPHVSDLTSSAALLGNASTSGDSTNDTREIIDITESPPPPPPRLHRPSRTSSSGSRRYVVPQWQADSEVSECPICKRPFTFMFRRHHCRKCGRVVCNDCSPHRITIPRQFIVNPPESNPSAANSATPRQIETIDLTGDDGQEDARHSQERGRSSTNSNLDGGEKVRLCNPCVPDPQPEPLPNFPPLIDHQDSTHASFTPGPMFASYLPPRPGTYGTNILGQPSRSGNGFPHFDQDFRYPVGQIFPGQHGGRPRHSSMINPYSNGAPHLPPPRFGNSGLTDFRPIPRARLLNNELPPLPGAVQGMPPFPGHGRYQSLDSSGRMDFDSSNRPRVRSLIDGGPRRPGMAPASFSSGSQLQGPPRPRLHESDICPVCRRALPSRGPNGDESAREAHIIACITARDPVNGGTQASSSSGMLHMVSFVANEKDCLGEDGNPQECSICMVEYEVGEHLSRLECFCKFHKECIVSWLSRKAECPVHKAGEMRML